MAATMTAKTTAKRRPPAEDVADRPHVGVAQPVEDAVEPEEERPEEAEAGLGRLVPLRDRLQQRGAEDGRQDEGHERPRGASRR